MRRTLFVVVATAALMLQVTVVAADTDPLDRFLDHEQRRLAPGPPSTQVTDNFEVLGHSNLIGGGPHGDVWFHDHGGEVGKHAYVGTWSSPCTGMGVKVIDVNDEITEELHLDVADVFAITPTVTMWQSHVWGRGLDGGEVSFPSLMVCHLDERGLIDWALWCVDGASVRAARAAAERRGVSRGRDRHGQGAHRARDHGQAP